MSSPDLSSVVDSAVTLESTAAGHTLHSSSSTQLLQGTLVIQSTSAALATPIAALSAPSGVPAQRVHGEAYQGEATSSSSLPSTDAFPSSVSSRAARRAAQGQTREELRQAFSVFDSAHTGRITTAEFGVVFKMLTRERQVTDEEIHALVTELDQEGNGTVSFQQLEGLMTRRHAAELTSHGLECIDPMDDALSVFDNDPRLAKMAVSEFNKICGLLQENLTDEEFEAVVRELQPDADGNFSYARLVHQMMPGS